jgi:FkbM family methyltransferase
VRRLLLNSLKSWGLYGTADATALGSNHHSVSTSANRTRMRRFYSQFITKGDLCFDVGANLGNRTEAFLELGATVVCIEPQQSCLEHLTSLFGNHRDVFLVGKAVGDHEGYAELAVCEDAPAISTLFDEWTTEGRFAKEYRWTRTERVPLTTLDALIATYGVPKFCKIDVEGYEKRVLRGLCQPVPIVSFEFTREFFQNARDCIDHMLSIGPKVFQVSIGETMEFLFEQWREPESLYKTLQSIDDQLLWGDIYAKQV